MTIQSAAKHLCPHWQDEDATELAATASVLGQFRRLMICQLRVQCRATQPLCPTGGAVPLESIMCCTAEN